MMLYLQFGEKESHILPKLHVVIMLCLQFTLRIIIIIMYLYSAQYFHILQDSKRYFTNPTVQVQPQLTSN